MTGETVKYSGFYKMADSFRPEAMQVVKVTISTVLLVCLSAQKVWFIYICDSGNLRVTVHDVEGMFLFAFGSKGSSPSWFGTACDVTCGSDGLVYVMDEGNSRVVWPIRGAVFREISRSCMTQPTLLLLVTTIC